MKIHPVFIASSGRSGSHKIANFLSEFENVQCQHEYQCIEVQILAMKYYRGLINRADARQKLNSLYSDAINSAPIPIWADSSNKIAWVLELLYQCFPQATFIHIVRDGRKVVSSYFNKLAHECYDDNSTRVLKQFFDNPNQYTEPPAEKKYWWPIPGKNHQLHEAFLHYTQFQRICFHWMEINSHIERAFSIIPPDQRYTFKLENLVNDINSFNLFCECFNIYPDNQAFERFKTPENVITPVNYELTEQQLVDFNNIAGETQRFYGYADSPGYELQYRDSIGRTEKKVAQ